MREEIYEIIMSEHFPKLMTENRPQIQEVQRKSSETNVKNVGECGKYYFLRIAFKH